MTPADRRRWATLTVARLAAGRPQHPYGTAAWNTCGDANLRFAALIVAAESWARDGDDLPTALLLQTIPPPVADGGEWALSDPQLAQLPALRAALLGDPQPLAALDSAAAAICPGPYNWDTVAHQAVAACHRAIDRGWRG